MRTFHVALGALVLLACLAGCRSTPEPLTPKDGAVWVNVNNYAVPGPISGVDVEGGFTPFPKPCPQAKMPDQPKPCAHPLTPVVFPSTGAPLESEVCGPEGCGVPAIATMGAGSSAEWLWLGFLILALVAWMAYRRHMRGATVVALVSLVLVLGGCQALSDVGDDANDAFLSAIGAAPSGSISTVGDGVGAPSELVWGGSGLATLASIFLVNFMRNRARKKRGEPVATAVARKDVPA